MITPKQAARLRHRLKTAGKLSDANSAKLSDYEANYQASKNQQPPAETPGDGGAGQPAGPPPSPANPVPPADTKPVPPPMESIPPIAPPPVTGEARGNGDWRDKWRSEINFSGDGRQMLCESIALSIAEGLGALRDETAKVTSPKTPDPRKIAGMFVLALDDLLPERARMTPRIGACAITAGTIIERSYHSKKIAEALKKDPVHQEWLRKQAEREANEQRQRAEHEAEVSRATQARNANVQYAEAPPAPEPTPINGTAIMVKPKPRETPLAEDADAIF